MWISRYLSASVSSLSLGMDFKFSQFLLLLIKPSIDIFAPSHVEILMWERLGFVLHMIQDLCFNSSDACMVHGFSSCACFVSIFSSYFYKVMILKCIFSSFCSSNQKSRWRLFSFLFKIFLMNWIWNSVAEKFA